MQTYSPASIQLTSRDAHVLRSLLSTSGFAREGDESPKQALTRLVSGAVTYPETPRRSDVVALYDHVTVAPLDDADESLLTFELVTPADSSSFNERVSVLAPLGLGVLGRKLGETVTVPLPSGQHRYRIAAVQKSGSAA